MLFSRDDCDGILHATTRFVVAMACEQRPIGLCSSGKFGDTYSDYPKRAAVNLAAAKLGHDK
jgi:hypothetical protein